jgi:hypothetical protein
VTAAREDGTRRRALESARHYVWTALPVFALVALVALARYAGSHAHGEQRYVTTQTLAVQQVPPDGGAFSAALAQEMARRETQMLASRAVVGSSTFAQAVVARIADSRDTLAARCGTGVNLDVALTDERAVQGAVSATPDDTRLILTTLWPSKAGACAVMTSAGDVSAAMTNLPTVASFAPSSGTVRVVPLGPASPPVVDPSLETSARARLLVTLLLGAAAGLLLAWLVGMWEASPMRSARQGTRAGLSLAETGLR